MRYLLELTVRLLTYIFLISKRLSRFLKLPRILGEVRSELLRRKMEGVEGNITIGKRFRVGRRVTVKIDSGVTVKIGDDVSLGDDSYIHVFPGAQLVFGNKVHINTHARVSAFVSIEIGDESALAAFSAIHDHHHRFDLKSPWGKHEYAGKPVKIGKNVMILARVGITEGVTIGDHCVVGANSIVTRDIPEGSLCGGVPAKVIRKVE